MLPIPARQGWSSSASSTGRSGSASSRRTASSGSQSGPSRSGPRWPTTLVLGARGPARRCRARSRRPTRRRCEHDPRLVGRPPPPLAGVVDLPGALHLQVGVQGSALRVDPGEQVLAARERLHDGAAGQVGRGERGHAEVGARSAPARPAPGRGACGPPDGVALGHGAPERSRRPRGVARKPASSSASRSGVAPEPRSCRRRPSRRSAGPGAAPCGVGERIGPPGARPGPASSVQVSSVLPPRST